MRFPGFCGWLLRLSVLACGTASASPIFLDGAPSAVEGNENSGFPFNIDKFSAASVRYQQVFDRTAFTEIPQGYLIRRIIFRQDGSDGSPFNTILPNVRIVLSTTSTTPDHFQLNFDANLGNDALTVFDGPLSLQSAYSMPSASPKPFDIVLVLASPFQYDPQAGNLLLDVRNFGGGTTTQFDSANNPHDGISRLYARDADAVLGQVDTRGLIVQFEFDTVSVPLPAAFPMFAGASGIFLLFLRRGSCSRA